MTDLDWLAAWFQRESSEAWLREHGVRLDSTENPGWWLRVDLAGTSLESRAHDGVLFYEGEPARDEAGQVVVVGKPGHSYTRCGASWFVCGIDERVFHAAGDAARLP